MNASRKSFVLRVCRRLDCRNLPSNCPIIFRALKSFVRTSDFGAAVSLRSNVSGACRRKTARREVHDRVGLRHATEWLLPCIPLRAAVPQDLGRPGN